MVIPAGCEGFRPSASADPRQQTLSLSAAGGPCLFSGAVCVSHDFDSMHRLHRDTNRQTDDMQDSGFSPFEAFISNFQSGVSLQGCLSLTLSRCSLCSSSNWFEWIHCLLVIPMSEERPRHVPFSSFILSEEVFIDDFYFYWCQENVFSLFVWIYRSLNMSKTEKELFFPPFDVLHVVHLVKHWTYILNDFQVFVAFQCLWSNMLCSFSFFCKTELYSSVDQRAHQIPTV